MTRRFRAGDLVSTGYRFGVVITGVVVELQGQHGPYVQVRVTAHPKPDWVGTLQWPEGWDLGIGPCEESCEQCGRRFRWDPAQPPELERTCHRCAHLDAIQAGQRAADTERRSSSWEQSQRRKREAS
jgi:hypothetical protein